MKYIKLTIMTVAVLFAIPFVLLGFIIAWPLAGFQTGREIAGDFSGWLRK